MGHHDRSSHRGSDRTSGRKHDRDRDYHRDRDDDRHHSKRHRSESDRRHSRHDRSRSRSRDRSRRDRDSRRPESDRRDRQDAGAGRGGQQKLNVPPLANGAFCYICGKPHWTVACPRLAARPHEYPLMSRKKGCWRCGQRGHPFAQCTVRKYRCRQCGGIHDTRDCAYDHVPLEWHEFFDPTTKHVFYVRSDDLTEVQWMPPSHELDVVMWYCAKCQHLNPNKYSECLVCHTARPVTIESPESPQGAGPEQAASSSSSDSDDSDDDSDSDSVRSTESSL